MTALPLGEAERPPLSPGRRAFLLVLVALLTGLFGALSTWQWQRLAWKEALIARVERQLAGPPQPAPPPPAWAALTRDDAEYRRVQLQGRYDHARETLVLASTELGRGHWVLTPLQTAGGWWVWVNRGYVDVAHRAASTRPTADGPVGLTGLTGLLRWSEPHGLPWQSNDPAAGRWASRDVAALSAAAGLPADATAPYFVDAASDPDAAAAADAFPRAGLTVVRFSNNHLVYALTWLALALGTAGAGAWFWREERRRRSVSRPEG